MADLYLVPDPPEPDPEPRPIDIAYLARPLLKRKKGSKRRWMWRSYHADGRRLGWHETQREAWAAMAQAGVDVELVSAKLRIGLLARNWLLRLPSLSDEDLIELHKAITAEWVHGEAQGFPGQEHLKRYMVLIENEYCSRPAEADETAGG